VTATAAAPPTPPGPPRSSNGAIGGTAKSIDPDLKPTSSDEIVIGGEYELFRDARAGLSFSRRWLNYFVEDMSNDGCRPTSSATRGTAWPAISRGPCATTTP
jgi:hypothetical protein